MLQFIRVGVDFPLPQGQAPGVEAKVTLGVQVTVQNTNQSQTFTYDLYVISIASGAWELDNGGGKMSIKCLTAGDVMKASGMPMQPLDEHARMKGGSFWDTIKSGISKAVNFVGNNAGKIGSIYKAVAPIVGLPSFGAGLRGRGLDLEMPQKRPRLEGAGFIDDSDAAQMPPEEEKVSADCGVSNLVLVQCVTS